MKKYIYLLLVFISFEMTSQNLDNISNTGMLVYTKNNTPSDYTGSPYAEKDFQSGIIMDTDKDKQQEAMLRYNAVEDVVEIKLNGDDEVHILPKLKNIKYDLGEYTYFIENFLTEDSGRIEGYFRQYYADKNILFISYPKADVTESTVNSTGYQKAKPAHLDVDMLYYVQKDGGRLKEVRLKEKDFKSIFSDKGKMEAYFKENKIKDEKDVVEMLKFYSE